MKKLMILLLGLNFGLTVNAQNADNLYFNSFNNGFDYQAASFVIDTALPAYPQQRAMLLWSANQANPITTNSLSLDETIANGMPVTQHINLQANVALRGLQPKKIIRSKFTKTYYLLAYVVGSQIPVNNILVNSTAFVLKLDDNLNLLWSSQIHFNPVTVNNAGALIEYNDLMEARDSGVVLVGRYANSSTSQQYVQMAKLNHNTGGLLWAFWYRLWSCNANGLSVTEAKNGELVLTGYAESCTPPAFTGNRQLLYGRTTALGAPIQFRKFLHSFPANGDKITRFLSPVGGADRFFITGYVNITATNRQNLVVDISQNGTINRASYFGDAGNEEVNDHIFSASPVANQFQLYLTGYTTSYIGGAREAYFSILRYNSTTLTFAISRYDVIRNYTGYSNRVGIELKNAGPNRFAILINSNYNTGMLPPYTHTYSNVYVRDLLANDTVCHRPKTPPLTNIFWQFLDTSSVVTPNYKVHPQAWTITPKLPYQLACGITWQIFPKSAVNAIVNPPDQIAPDVVTVAKATDMVSQEKEFTISGSLYPNPATNYAVITLDKQFMSNTKQQIAIRILSTKMQLLRTEKINYQPNYKISLAGLLPGVYFIELQQGATKQVVRLVKQ